MDLETEVIAQTYKHLWTVEDMFRTMKSLLTARPIYHKRDETILGHVFCSFLALRMRRELENRMEQQDKAWEWGEIIRGLDNLSEATLTFVEKEYALRSQLSGLANVALQGAGVAVPPTLREL